MQIRLGAHRRPLADAGDVEWHVAVTGQRDGGLERQGGEHLLDVGHIRIDVAGGGAICRFLPMTGASRCNQGRHLVSVMPDRPSPSGAAGGVHARRRLRVTRISATRISAARVCAAVLAAAVAVVTSCSGNRDIELSQVPPGDHVDADGRGDRLEWTVTHTVTATTTVVTPTTVLATRP